METIEKDIIRLNKAKEIDIQQGQIFVEGDDELEVYHIPNDNSLEKVNSKYSDGELQFNINHFSKFTIV